MEKKDTRQACKLSHMQVSQAFPCLQSGHFQLALPLRFRLDFLKPSFSRSLPVQALGQMLAHEQVFAFSAVTNPAEQDGLVASKPRSEVCDREVYEAIMENRQVYLVPGRLLETFK